MNPIDEVLERFHDGALWQQDDIGAYDKPDEPVCLIGGWAAVHGGCQLAPEIHTVILEQFPDRAETLDQADGYVFIPSFNDHVDTRWPDVRLVLEKASLLYDEHAVQS